MGVTDGIQIVRLQVLPGDPLVLRYDLKDDLAIFPAIWEAFSLGYLVAPLIQWLL